MEISALSTKNASTCHPSTFSPPPFPPPLRQTPTLDMKSLSTKSYHTANNSPYAKGSSQPHGSMNETIQGSEARIMRQRVLESQNRRKNMLGENTPVAKADLSGGGSSSSPLFNLLPLPGENVLSSSLPRSSQDTLRMLATKQKQLEEEIARAKAQLERSKPSSRADSRMRKRGLWPQTDPQALIFYISDDEEDSNEGTTCHLQVIPDHP
ncbi:hypothetical protein R3P38DRAFT_3186774 [Favolaschia claudopus]|uniref:Uncharacterized protein n=1 Tax=Favolaschia claudopus TaxID=2862362 RepID=A0AAW0C511_9AGAR